MNHVSRNRKKFDAFCAPHTARSVFSVSLLLSVVVFTSCAIYPMKTRTVEPTGVEKPLDLDFIQVNKTTRDEVATKLAWMDTDLKHSRLFWGRWDQSSSGGAYLPAVLVAAPAGRRWYTKNLVVEFNKDGKVEHIGQLSDAKLNEELQRWLQGVGEPPLDLSAPLVIEMPTASRRMTLTRDLVEFVLWDGRIFQRSAKGYLEIRDTGEVAARGSRYRGIVPFQS